MLAGRTDLAFILLPHSPPVPNIFYEAFISQAWCAGEVISHTLKNRIRLSQGSDAPTAGSFKWIHPSSTLFLPLFPPLLCQQRDHSSSHTFNGSSWSDGEPDGNFFFLSLALSLCIHRIPLMTTERSRQGKVFYKIFSSTLEFTTYKLVYINMTQHCHIPCLWGINTSLPKILK